MLERIWYRRIEDDSQRGILDLFGCVGPFFFVLELKRDRAAAKAKRDGHELQKWMLRTIQKTGAFARVVYPENWDMVYEELKELK